MIGAFRLGVVAAALFGRRTPEPPPVDPHFTQVKALLHFEGTSGVASFVDVKGHTFSAFSGAVLSSALARFGGTSGAFLTSGYIATAGSADFALPGDFTIEYFVYRLAGGAFQSHGAIVGTTTFYWFVFNNNQFTAGFSGVGSMSGGSVPVGQWVHVAITRSSGTLRAFLDGVLIASGSFGSTITGSPVLRVGFETAGAGSNPNCYIDEFRLTIGVARYVASFSPPTAPFPDA